MSKLDWHPERVTRAIETEARGAMDDTMAAASIEAKRNHPGWRNRTGTAEGSIRADATKVEGRTIIGRFGSFAVRYFIWLEIGARGRAGDYTLRRAAGKEFPAYPQRLIARLRRIGVVR